MSKLKQSLDVFKEECRKEKEAEVKDKEGYEKWQKLQDEQKEFGISYEPIFFFWNFCPNCHSVLDSKIVKKVPGSSTYILYSCPKCRYEYAW
jgi:hypothetical protein